mgnify:CR=1 FL=1
MLFSALARAFLRGVVLVNRIYMRMYRIPRLYSREANIRFRREPWQAKGLEEFATCLTVLRRGWGDCDDLAPYRVAELQEAGDPDADLRIYWRRDDDGVPKIFHVQVRHGNGQIEDPSRYLGMPGAGPPRPLRSRRR